MVTPKQPRAQRSSSSTRAALRGTPRGLSVHVGLNSVNAKHYSGWSGQLTAAEADAKAFASLATANNMKAHLLISEEATRSNVIAAIRSAAAEARKGDLFFLSFSGYGGQLPNYRARAPSETWCLYDALLIQDEIYTELNRFPNDARLLLIMDSGRGVTITRSIPGLRPDADPARSRALPPSVTMRVFNEHTSLYERLLKDVASDPVFPAIPRMDQSSPVAAAGPPTVVITSAMAVQTALDGLFTSHLLREWRNGQFQGNYLTLVGVLKRTMPMTQTPHIVTLGSVQSFLREHPFSVSGTKR